MIAASLAAFTASSTVPPASLVALAAFLAASITSFDITVSPLATFARLSIFALCLSGCHCFIKSFLFTPASGPCLNLFSIAVFAASGVISPFSTALYKSSSISSADLPVAFKISSAFLAV